ncbi:unnamed protein product, partial [Brachionus calyciflorus]
MANQNNQQLQSENASLKTELESQKVVKCPVCLVNPNGQLDFLAYLCGHIVCVECKDRLLLFCCLLVFPNILVHGYFVTEAFFSEQNQEKIYVDLEINHVIKDNDLFPNTFKVKFSELGHKIESEITQAAIDNNQDNLNVFYQDQNGNFVQHLSHSSK